MLTTRGASYHLEVRSYKMWNTIQLRQVAEEGAQHVDECVHDGYQRQHNVEDIQARRHVSAGHQIRKLRCHATTSVSLVTTNMARPPRRVGQAGVQVAEYQQHLAAPLPIGRARMREIT